MAQPALPGSGSRHPRASAFQQHPCHFFLSSLPLCVHRSARRVGSTQRWTKSWKTPAAMCTADVFTRTCADRACCEQQSMCSRGYLGKQLAVFAAAPCMRTCADRASFESQLRISSLCPREQLDVCVTAAMCTAGTSTGPALSGPAVIQLLLLEGGCCISCCSWLASSGNVCSRRVYEDLLPIGILLWSSHTNRCCVCCCSCWLCQRQRVGTACV